MRSARALLFVLALLLAAGPARATLNLTWDWATVPTDCTAGQTCDVQLVITRAGGSDEDWNVNQLCNSGFRVLFKPSSWTWAQKMQGGAAACFSADAVTAGNPVSQAVTVGTLSIPAGAAVATHQLSFELQIPGTSSLVGPAGLLQVAVSAPAAAGRTLLAMQAELPVSNAWRMIPDTELQSWGRDCASGPCQIGDTVLTTNAEADAIDTQIWEGGSYEAIQAWTGMAYSPAGQKIYLSGGGHNAYRGCEVYEIDLSTITFTRLLLPLALITGPTGDPVCPSGIQPAHTQDALTWTPGGTNGKLWHLTTGVNPTDGDAKPNVFDLDTNSWHNVGDWQVSLSGAPHAAYDATTDQLCQVAGIGGQFVCYDNTLETISHSGSGNYALWSPGVMRPWDGGFIANTDNNLSSPGDLRTIDINGGNETALYTWPAGMNVQGGFTFCGNEHWATDGAGDVWSRNPFTGETRTHTPGSPRPTGTIYSFGSPVGSSIRVYSKFECLPETGGMMMIHSVGEGVWQYCPPEGCIQPQATIWSKSFEQRCEETPGIIFCGDFSNTEDLGTQGIADRIGRFHSGASDCGSLICPVLTNGVLDFQVPADGGENTSGQWYVDITQLNGGSAFQPGDQVNIQWKQKIGARMLQDFANGGGWKVWLLGAPDQTSCSTNEIVVQNTSQRMIPHMYHKCPPNTEPFEFANGTNFDVQPRDPDYPGPGGLPAEGDFCSWDEIQIEGNGLDVPGCLPFVADEWMTFQVQIDLESSPTLSHITMWMARESEEAPQIVMELDWDIENAANNAGWGKFWITPFHAGSTETDPTVTFSHIDELIIATSLIPHS